MGRRKEGIVPLCVDVGLCLLYKVRKAEVCLQALFDLEATNQELKSDLRDLYITGAREVDVNASRKAIIIHVSPP